MTITHVYFSGGGIKGLCYLGIIRYIYIEKMMKHIRDVAGTSVGAYFALVLALQIPLEFLEEQMMLIVENFNLMTPENYLYIDETKFANLLTKNGMLTIEFLLDPVVKYLELQYGASDLTFIEFAKKTGINLYVNSININHIQNVTFCVDETPNVSVIDAVKASMSIPFMFEPVLIDGEYYIDGVRDFNDIFKDVDKRCLLYIILCKTSEELPSVFEKDSDIPLMRYMGRIMEVVLLKMMVTDDSVNGDHILKINEFPYNKFMKFKVADKYMNVELTQENFDNLILKGFIDISNYMQKRLSDT